MPDPGIIPLHALSINTSSLRSWKSEKVIRSCPTLGNPMDSSWVSPGQNTGVGSFIPREKDEKIDLFILQIRKLRLSEGEISTWPLTLVVGLLPLSPPCCPSPGPQPCLIHQGDKSQALYLLSLEAYTIAHCESFEGESPGIQWGMEERDAMLDRCQMELFSTRLLRELRQKDPTEEAESVPGHSTTMRNFGSSEIDRGSPGHSLKIRSVCNVCLSQILRDLCSCPSQTLPSPKFSMSVGAEKPICPLERGHVVTTTWKWVVFIPNSGREPGEGNGKPIQYPCLENPKDRGAWWAAVHGVAESQAWLSD